MNEFLTSTEVAAIFKVHRATVTSWPWPPGSYIKTPGGRLRYRSAAVVALIDASDPFGAGNLATALLQS